MYLISYDITDTKVRNKVAKELENYGRRVQYSVFECELSVRQYHILYQKLFGLMTNAEGNIRLYMLCPSCTSKTVQIGNVQGNAYQISEDNHVLIV